jgi:hypothetical protein
MAAHDKTERDRIPVFPAGESQPTLGSMLWQPTAAAVGAASPPVTDPAEIPPFEGAQRYRELAAQARRDAQRTQGSIRDGYLMIERGWLTLAADVEAAITRDSAQDADMKPAAFRPPTGRKD